MKQFHNIATEDTSSHERVYAYILSMKSSFPQKNNNNPTSACAKFHTEQGESLNLTNLFKPIIIFMC